jgi:geranylgeranyl pyrophosphate synthase
MRTVLLRGRTRAATSGEVIGRAFARRTPQQTCGARRRLISGDGGHDPFKSTDPFALVQGQLNDLTGNIGELLRTAGDSPVLDAVATYFFQSGTRAKHFRPSVVLLVGRATAAHSDQQQDVANESQQRLAEIAEMIHTASLLHDDVIDESDERRGKASGNAAFGNKVAVLAGDFLLARASMTLARLRNTEVVEVVSLVIEELVQGELLQIRVGSGSADGLNPEELLQLYLRKNYLKTGSLIANAAKASAMLGEHSEEVCMSAYNYGRHLGLAFQLMDDALDFKASAEALVRPATLNLFSLVPALLNKASAWRKLLSPHLQRH